MKKLGLAVLFLFAGISSALAADFETTVTAEYTFHAGAPAKVKLDYTLTNTNPVYFVDNYQIVLPGDGISGLVLQQKEQEITKEQHSDHNRQILELSFENEVVGQGKSRQFSLEYTDSNLLQPRGGSSLIRINPLVGSEHFDHYKTIVRLPQTFGAPDLVQPEPVKVGTGSGQLVYTFDQSQGEKIEIGFGRDQVLQFSLNAQRRNRTNFPAYQTVRFPGNRDQVQFIYRQIAPQPVAWYDNDDGSWMGVYLLDTGEQLNVAADGYLIYNQIDHDFYIRSFYPGMEQELSVMDTFGDADLEATKSVTITADVKQHGILPILDRYQFKINNLSGAQRDNWFVRIMSHNPKIRVGDSVSPLTLKPWQATMFTTSIRGPWWQPYSFFELQVEIIDEQGERVDAQTVRGLSLSYPAFAALGALIAIAGVAWSLLVDGRQQKGNLCRQSEKSQE